MSAGQDHEKSGSAENKTVSAAAAGSPVTRVVVRYLLPLIVVAVGGAGAVHLYLTKPKAKQRKPVNTAKVVDVATLTRSKQRVLVPAMGTVKAAQEVVLQPQVSGKIIKVSDELIPGGRVRAGDVLAIIDPADYQTTLERAEADLAGRRAEQQSAAWEMERLRRLESRQAANKKEMDDARTAKEVADAAAVSASAAVEQAKLDRQRTTIKAPFNGIITTKDVDLGALVSPQSQIATLVGTDEYWVEASVRVDRLEWITIPAKSGQAGSLARIRPSREVGSFEWTGHVLRLLGELEQEGRMARLLVVVKDPLGQGASKSGVLPLLIGAYVRVEIEGAELDGVFAIPRTALRDGQRVWLMDETNRLVIKQVRIAWRGQDTVLVKNDLADGAKLVISNISTPVEGMALRTAADAEAKLADGRGTDSQKDRKP
ncbi:MAG: efflux RND transporter periplasmic adaptor subunit [Phycisphaerae bacterium]|nr:efflux RND transporter periplasmic adaptor subunit [Phycisphaerae bacterium]